MIPKYHWELAVYELGGAHSYNFDYSRVDEKNRRSTPSCCIYKILKDLEWSGLVDDFRTIGCIGLTPYLLTNALTSHGVASICGR